jgi:outer membrane protein assembly factor BamD (BamD/ComL family)
MAIESIDDGSLFTELKKLSGSEEKKRNIDRSFKHSANDLSIQDLMNLARGRKSSGNWTGAVSSYNELIRLYADSDEARTSTLSIGQIYLHHLNKPKAALAAFNDYLKQPGPLTQEALYGRAQAFRSLQDLKNEIESLHSFLNSFPDGVYAPAVQNRLRELQ